MKKCSYTFLLTFLFSSLLSAQITITIDDAPQVGDSLTFATDTVPGTSIVPGPAGEGRLWDFSQLVPADTFSIKVVAIEETPDAEFFPQANAAIEIDSVFLYAELTDDALFILGTAVDLLETGMPFVARFDPPQKFFQFPTSYGTEYDNRSRLSLQADGDLVGLPFDSVRLVRTIFDTIVADAYGMLTTPVDTYDALRLGIESRTVDSLFANSFGTWVLIGSGEATSVEYRWLAKEAKGNVVTMSLDENGLVESVDWLIGVNEEAQAPVAAFSFEDLGGGTFAFTDASTNAPTSWQWDFGDDETSAAQNPEHTFVMGGRYDVCLTAANSAGSNTACQEVNVVITSTENLERQYGFRLFPNPAGSLLMIELDQPAPAGTLITFSTFSGQTLFTRELAVTQRIDTGAWPAGNYVFLVRSAKGQLLGSGKVRVE